MMQKARTSNNSHKLAEAWCSNSMQCAQIHGTVCGFPCYSTSCISLQQLALTCSDASSKLSWRHSCWLYVCRCIFIYGYISTLNNIQLIPVSCSHHVYTVWLLINFDNCMYIRCRERAVLPPTILLCIHFRECIYGGNNYWFKIKTWNVGMNTWQCSVSVEKPIFIDLHGLLSDWSYNII